MAEQNLLERDENRAAYKAERARTAPLEPGLSPSTGSLWAQCDRERDRIYSEALAAASARQANLLILKSQPGEYPVWVSIDSWVRIEGSEDLTRRLSFKLIVTVQPHRKKLFKVELIHTDGAASRSVLAYKQPKDIMPTAAIEALMAYLLGGAPRPAFLRQGWIDRCLETFGADKFEQHEKSSDWPLALLLFIPYLNFLVMVIIAAKALGSARGGKNAYYRDASRPSEPPRNYVAVDSWHTVVRGLGAEVDQVRALVATVLGDASIGTLGSERIVHGGLDTVETREQLIASYRRATVFVHVEAYGGDLYVAWDGHINRSAWGEQFIHSDTTEGSRINFYSTVQPVEHAVTHYDIADFNTLSQWVHRKVSDELTRLMRERKIDQAIDFEIIRGSRRTSAIASDEGERTRRVARVA